MLLAATGMDVWLAGVLTAGAPTPAVVAECVCTVWLDAMTTHAADNPSALATHAIVARRTLRSPAWRARILSVVCI